MFWLFCLFTLRLNFIIFQLMIATWARFYNSFKWIFFLWFLGNTSSNNIAFIDFIMVSWWMYLIFNFYTRNWYALLLYAYPIKKMIHNLRTYLYLFGIKDYHFYTLRYLLKGFLYFHNLYNVFSNFFLSLSKTILKLFFLTMSQTLISL